MRLFVQLLATHRADMVRCWAAYVIGQDPDMCAVDAFAKIRQFAADTHFGVRECSWMAVRHRLVEQLPECLEILTPWVSNSDENVRRFACEATRPRGVWAVHLKELQENPQLALPILEPLRADSAKYVRDSVGNWLNDASKTQSDFVRELCHRWEVESPVPETTYIVKKRCARLAQRTNSLSK